MASELVARGVRGGRVVVLGQAVKILAQMTGVVVLSRLLEPTDFGLIAMVALFLALGDLIRDFGLPLAALQTPTLSQAQASNFFWASALLGATMGGVLVALTPVIVSVFDEPRLQTLVPVMALTLPLNGLQAQIGVQIARAMRFSVLALTDVCAQLAGLTAAIIGALADLGYWALVFQVLTVPLVLLISRVVASRWRPSLPKRRVGTRKLLKSGGELGLASLLSFAATNVDTLVIGMKWSAASLGYYSRAYQLFTTPKMVLLDPLTPVVLPTINETPSNGARRSLDILLRLQFALGVPVAWVYLLGAATAGSVIPLLLGDQWRPVVPVFTVLAIGGFFAAFGYINYWTFMVMQKSGGLLRLHLITKPLNVLLVVIAAPQGIVAVALAQACSLAINWPINLLWLSRTTDLDFWAFFKNGIRIPVAAGAALIAARMLQRNGGQFPVFLEIFGGAALASGVYLLLLVLLPGGWRDLRLLMSASAFLKGGWRRSRGMTIDPAPTNGPDER